ncbi:MAG TPA: DegT/DnrJ/EryC1/StrS family aminotransferase [Blastococcus sp.]|nr:DegT/DnrJ/EryC1/StrS family aminotransferase [Blastococcus sp.]
MIPISSVSIGTEEEELVLQVIRSGRLAQGPMVERLEQEFRAWSGTEHVIAVANGTVSLVAALEALRLPPGSEVVTSPFTFAATLNAILEAGLVARFGDIDPGDFALTTESVEAAAGDRTSAIMPVHLYGLPADMTALVPLAESHGWAVVEDAAQAHGARVGDRPVGSFGVGSFSLYATKNLMSGEGGLVTTDDDEIADRLRLIRNQGMRARYQHELAGHNFRLTELQAAVAVPQLARLGAANKRRGETARRLTEGLSGITGLALPRIAEGRTHVWHQYTVRVTPESGTSRDRVADVLTERGVGSGLYYPRPVYDYECYRTHPRVVIGEHPVAERVSSEVLSIPVHPALSDADVDIVIAGVRGALHAD